MAISYTQMVLESDRVPSKVNIAAALCCWWAMAGFLVLPGAFTSLEKSKALQAQPDLEQHIKIALPLVAVFCFISGAGGICYLWRRFRHNYIWLSNRLMMYVSRKPITRHSILKWFRPTLASAANCLYTILVSIYTAQDGYWSWPAYFAFASVTFTMVSTILALAFYHYQLRLMGFENRE
jgi:hypothetical protein